MAIEFSKIFESEISIILSLKDYFYKRKFQTKAWINTIFFAI